MSDKPQPQPCPTTTSPTPSAPSDNGSQPHLQCIDTNMPPLPVSFFFHSYSSIFNVSMPPHTSMTTTHMTTMTPTMTHMVAGKQFIILCIFSVLNDDFCDLLLFG